MKCLMWSVSLWIGLGLTVAIAQPPEGGGRGLGGGASGGGGARPPSQFVMALDVDQDGEISADEIKNAAKALLTLDKNNDGKLTEDEYRPQGNRPGGGPGGPECRPVDPRQTRWS